MTRLRHWLASLVGVAAIASLITFTSTGHLEAADHGDSPAPATANADIADHYAWMTDDGSKLVMVMTLSSGFQDGVQYVFHVNSMAAYGATASTANIILCTVSPGGSTSPVECFVSNDDSTSGGAAYKARVAGNRDTTLGDASFRVFAGRRDDPFFFNAAGFGATITAVRAAAGGLDFNAEGCPAVDGGTSGTLVGLLASNGDGSTPGTDSFAGGDIDAIVVEIDKALINTGGEILATYSSTRSGS